MATLFQLPQLNLPVYSYRFRREEKKKMIWDDWRKKYVALTPEEWVRQNIVMFLCEEKKYPKGLIALETEIKLNRTKKRCDAVVHGKSGKPVMIIECKSPSVKISQKVFDQVARYNIPLGVDYLLVTNGKEHYCCQFNSAKGKYEFLKEIPEYQAPDSTTNP